MHALCDHSGSVAGLKKGERHLDIGMGWGTLVNYAAKNFESQSTGVTLAENQVLGSEKCALCGSIRDKARVVWELARSNQPGLCALYLRLNMYETHDCQLACCERLCVHVCMCVLTRACACSCMYAHARMGAQVKYATNIAKNLGTTKNVR